MVTDSGPAVGIGGHGSGISGHVRSKPSQGSGSIELLSAHAPPSLNRRKVNAAAEGLAATAADLGRWPLPDGVDEAALERRLFADTGGQPMTLRTDQ